MHSKVSKIGAAGMLIAFLFGVGSGTVALSKPQVSQVNGTITSEISEGTNATNSCSIKPVLNSKLSNLSSSLLNFVNINYLNNLVENKFYQTRILINNQPSNIVNGGNGLNSPNKLASLLAHPTNSVISALKSTEFLNATTNISTYQPIIPTFFTIKSFTVGIPPILEGLAVISLDLEIIKKIIDGKS